MNCPLMVKRLSVCFAEILRMTDDADEVRVQQLNEKAIAADL